MKENKDRHQVVIAREMYDDLMYLATIGDNKLNGSTKVTSHVRRHAQKYNKHLHEERQVEVAKYSAAYREMRTKVISVICAFAGKMVWTKIPVPPPPGLTERPTVFMAVKVVGRSELDKCCVKVKNMDGSGLRDIHIHVIYTELPEGYTYEEKGMHKYIAYDPRLMVPTKPFEIRRGS